MSHNVRGNNEEERDNEMSPAAFPALAAPALAQSDAGLVLRALRNPKYKWRSIDGIARETRLSRDRIEDILAEEKSIVLRSSLPDRKGRALFTTVDHYKAHSSIISKVWSALSDQLR
jgi:hypothetical protein